MIIITMTKVKDKAFQIIVSLKYSPNYEIVFRELENEDSSFANIVHRHTTMIFKTVFYS
jgi:hypothetical protein